jgi:hypothetical protein
MKIKKRKKQQPQTDVDKMITGRDILNTIWPRFFLFDLYLGHKNIV